MKIFSNFDTNYKSDVVTKFVMEHGRDNVLVISRSSLFLWIEVNIPFLLYTIGFVGLLYGIFFFRDHKDIIISNVLITVITLIYILLLAPVCKRLIDYYCDFTIITPTGVFLYNQRGIIYRTTSAMNIENIRTVNVKKSTLLYALFNNGDIIFLSEGVDSDLGEAMVYYVANPEEKRDKIEELFEKGRQLH